MDDNRVWHFTDELGWEAVHYDADTNELTLGNGDVIEAPKGQELRRAVVEDVDDMTQLIDMCEATIYSNLKERFAKGQIYTRISSLLVSVNPFEMLPIYGESFIKKYHAASEGGAQFPPHVYGIAQETYAALCKHNKGQSVIISGESGAGKTEAAKLVLQYLAHVSNKGNEIEKQVTLMNPVIEAFGNAKTVRNDNSSRFGKWMELLFDDADKLCGLNTIKYMLEKSRIVSQLKNERNFHIFYQLVSYYHRQDGNIYGIDRDARSYYYLNQGECTSIDSMDDSEEFDAVLQGLEILNFSKQDCEDLFKTVSAVLHLGEIQYGAREGVHSDEAVITNEDDLIKVASLLKIDQEVLRNALLFEVIQFGDETIRKQFNSEGAAHNRDAFAKAIYSGVFDWIIHKVNVALSTKQKKCHKAGILDIFGFELLEQNYFEQMCINYANEKLQFFFNNHIFKVEQEEYRKEKIAVDYIEYTDNQATVDLIEKSGVGIISLIDDVGKATQTTDASLLETFHQRLLKPAEFKGLYIKPKISRPEFGIVHYAGQVQYQIEGFLERNKDRLGANLAECVATSKNPITMSLLSVHDSRSSKKKNDSIASQFRGQLLELMDMLEKTEPKFIRCLKSNDDKEPQLFQADLILRQMRYLGIEAICEIRQSGFSFRVLHRDFARQYNCLLRFLSLVNSKPVEQCQGLLEAYGGDSEEWKMGKTKVFMKAFVMSRLDKEKNTIVRKCTIKLQAWFRGQKDRCLARTLRKVCAILNSVRNLKKSSNPLNTIEKLRSSTAAVQALLQARGIPLNEYSYIDVVITEFQHKLSAMEKEHAHELERLRIEEEARIEAEREKERQRQLELERQRQEQERIQQEREERERQEAAAREAELQKKRALEEKLRLEKERELQRQREMEERRRQEKEAELRRIREQEEERRVQREIERARLQAEKEERERRIQEEKEAELRRQREAAEEAERERERERERIQQEEERLRAMRMEQEARRAEAQRLMREKEELHQSNILRQTAELEAYQRQIQLEEEHQRLIDLKQAEFENIRLEAEIKFVESKGELMKRNKGLSIELCRKREELQCEVYAPLSDPSFSETMLSDAVTVFEDIKEQVDQGTYQGDAASVMEEILHRIDHVEKHEDKIKGGLDAIRKLKANLLELSQAMQRMDASSGKAPRAKARRKEESRKISSSIVRSLDMINPWTSFFEKE